MLISVWRKDGTRVVIRKEPTWTDEFRAVFKLIASRRIALLLPAFFIRSVTCIPLSGA
jgi:hypothetical protein